MPRSFRGRVGPVASVSQGEMRRTTSKGPAAVPPRCHRAHQLRLVPWPGRRRPGLPAAGGHHDRPRLARPCRPLPAHGHPLRPASATPPRLLGQQRPLLRNRGRPCPGLRPDRRTAGPVRLRPRPRRGPRRPRDPGHRRRPLVQLRAPGHPERPRTVHRLGDGQRGHRPRTPALRTAEPWGRSPVRVRLAGPASRARFSESGMGHEASNAGGLLAAGY